MSTPGTTASHPVLFSTSTPHVLPPSKYFIPNTWARFQLSQLINKVLDLPQPIPFDFLIRGEVLNGTIAEWCSERGVKEEETLEIEYFESLMPPKFLSSLGGEEWIGSVSCQLPGYILAGSYDSNVRIYNSSQNLLHTISGHNGPVTSTCWVPTQSPSSRIIASASHDSTGSLTSFNTEGSEAPRTLAALHLHTAPLSSIACNTSGSHVLTASWDGLIGLFSTSIPDVDEAPEMDIQEDRKKRRRVVSDDKPRRKVPVHVLKSHTARISRATFSRLGNYAYSCGFDSTLRSWDLENGVCTGTITLNEKPMTDLTITSDGQTALAACTDRTVGIFDLRSAFVGQLGPLQNLMHSAFPASLSAHPMDVNKVMSGSYDGIVRIWDLRSLKSAVSSFAIQGKEGVGKKIMSVDWAPGLLGVGGEAGIEVWRVNDGGKPL